MHRYEATRDGRPSSSPGRCEARLRSAGAGRLPIIVNRYNTSHGRLPLYVISRRWLDDWESHAGVSRREDQRGPSTHFSGPDKTLGFTLGLSNGALVVRSVKPTCAHSRTLSIGAALTHLNDVRVVCEDENEFTSLTSLKQAERPLKLTFGGLDDALSPRPRRGADRPFTIRNADLLEAKEITDSPESPARLLRHLQQGRDYELLSQDEWQALKGWYGAGRNFPKVLCG